MAGDTIPPGYRQGRALDPRDEEPARYADTVRCFFAGVAVLVAGVFGAAIIA